MLLARNQRFEGSEPDSGSQWTEFKLFSLGAVHAYTLDTGDTTLANRTFDTLLEPWLAKTSTRAYKNVFLLFCLYIG